MLCTTTLLTQLYVRVGILHTSGKHMHDRITLQGVDVWIHTISLTLSLFVEVHVTSYECEQSCICMLGISILSILLCYDGFSIRFWKRYYSMEFVLFQYLLITDNDRAAVRCIYCTWLLCVYTIHLFGLLPVLEGPPVWLFMRPSHTHSVTTESYSYPGRRRRTWYFMFCWWQF